MAQQLNLSLLGKVTMEGLASPTPPAWCGRLNVGQVSIRLLRAIKSTTCAHANVLVEQVILLSPLGWYSGRPVSLWCVISCVCPPAIEIWTRFDISKGDESVTNAAGRRAGAECLFVSVAIAIWCSEHGNHELEFCSLMLVCWQTSAKRLHRQSSAHTMQIWR